MSVVQIAGARPGAGATTVACGLALLLRSQGKRVTLVKPLSPPGDADPAFLASLGGSAETVAVEGAASTEQVTQAAKIVQSAAAGWTWSWWKGRRWRAAGHRSWPGAPERR